MLRDSSQALGDNDAVVDEISRCDRNTQSHRPDEVGRAYEHAESPGGVNDFK